MYNPLDLPPKYCFVYTPGRAFCNSKYRVLIILYDFYIYAGSTKNQKMFENKT